MKIPLRWIVLIGSFISYLFEALEVVILSLALPSMRKDIGFGVVEGGLLATVTLLGMGASSIIGGRFADRFGRKIALLTCLIVFGTMTTAISFANDLGIVLILRAIAGLGLGGIWAVVSAYVVETWPPEKRGRAVAFVLSSFPAGGILAAVVAANAGTDWRMMFLMAGLGTILPILFVTFLFHESKVWLDSSAGRARTTGEAHVRYGLRDLFGPGYVRITIVGTLVCAFALLGYWGISAWLPTFLAEGHKIEPASVAFLIGTLNFFAFVGYNVFGVIADKIGRKRALFVSLLGAGLILPFYAVTQNETVLLALGPLYAFFACFTGILGSYLSELFPTELRATGAGFCFNIGRGLSAMAPLLLGFIAASYGFAPGFVICGGFFATAAILVLFLPRPQKIEVDAATTEDERKVIAEIVD